MHRHIARKGFHVPSFQKYLNEQNKSKNWTDKEAFFVTAAVFLLMRDELISYKVLLVLYCIF